MSTHHLRGARHLRVPRPPGRPASVPAHASPGRRDPRRRRPHLQPVPRRLRPLPGQPARRARGSRSTRCWWPRSPPPGTRPGRPTAWSTRCSAARSQQLGYDRDFGLLREVEDEAVTATRPHPAVDAWQEIGLDPDGAIRIPAGTALDLGATGKAWAADLIAAAVTGSWGSGPSSAWAATSRSPRTTASRGRSRSPPGPAIRAEVTVTLDRGGLATSSTQVRRWTRRGVQVHHLLDPRTGLPAADAWRTVTATGPTAIAANTATTAAVVLGPEAPRWLGRPRRHRPAGRGGRHRPHHRRLAGRGAPRARGTERRMTDGRVPVVPQPQHRLRDPGAVHRHHRRSASWRRGAGPAAGCRASSARRCTATSRCWPWSCSLVHIVVRGRRHVRRHPLVAGRGARGSGRPTCPLWLGLGTLAFDLLAGRDAHQPAARPGCTTDRGGGDPPGVVRRLGRCRSAHGIGIGTDVRDGAGLGVRASSAPVSRWCWRRRHAVGRLAADTRRVSRAPS